MTEVRLSPVLTETGAYPFARLNQAVAERRARGGEVVDLGVGDPREPADPRIVQALRDGVRDRMGYPTSAGLPELREAIAQWVDRRFAVSLDPDIAIVPTLGSKEAIFSFAQLVLDPAGGKDTVVVTEPGYPVPARGAAFAGAHVVSLPLVEAHGFLPDLDAVPDSTWRRTAVLWLNYPNNPTAVAAGPDLFAQAARLARAHAFALASDEAYSELWFSSPPRSALELPDLTNIAVFNTLSKRSSMTGFRSGFVAGDPILIDALKRFRPTTGTVPQEFVQRASVVAWSDERHVEATRESYAHKRGILVDALSRAGLRIAGGDATMFLWVAVPSGTTSEEYATHLLDDGIVVAPGSFLGPSGEGYVRLAFVAPVEECIRAAALIERAASATPQ